jgi:hypothetical protein
MHITTRTLSLIAILALAITTSTLLASNSFAKINTHHHHHNESNMNNSTSITNLTNSIIPVVALAILIIKASSGQSHNSSHSSECSSSSSDIDSVRVPKLQFFIYSSVQYKVTGLIEGKYYGPGSIIFIGKETCLSINNIF